MRHNSMKALPWLLLVPLLSGWITPPTPPASGNIADTTGAWRSVSVGGSVQTQCYLRPGYEGFRVQVQAGSQLRFETTHLGSSMYLDTGLFIYGPKDANGSYGSVVRAHDDDSGYGELSRIEATTFPQGGEYLVVVGWHNAADKQYRLQVDCVGGTCLSQQPQAPAAYTLSLVEQNVTPSLLATLNAANEVREDRFSYLRRFDFHWPYSTEASLDRAAAAVLAQGLYEGYRSDSAPVALTYAQFLSTMYGQFQPLHAAILATYGDGSENVQVKRYHREFSTGPNGDNWRSLNVILFPRSHKVIVYEQTAHEI
ncbi:hypothetical protein HPC49_07750 [Pyxidicoccus fallax]|uniref:Peptidase C-terminal archaeal/bacterial domain-containing protein n=1 Tax=Pyxidicoccus fallax TaxID=394095 RepID=A0A848LE93_9BACT|nr:hypothetical protein [Pyxidicoccus fallax]NMO16532.1 hypothetical protein [Pyxidicoccus fallax]NPC78147.1 hypothetical protein [Pyxidicoccus fallax]